MKETIFLAIAAILLWGGWGFFAKIAISKAGWHTAFVISYIISASLALIIFLQKVSFKAASQNILYIILSSLCVLFGSIFFYLLLAKKQAGLAAALTSLYPAITIILGYLFLQEALSLKQIIGAVLALIAIFLLAL